MNPTPQQQSLNQQVPPANGNQLPQNLNNGTGGENNQ